MSEDERHSARGRETSDGAIMNQSAFSKPPETPEQQRRRKLMGGLVWKFLVFCVFVGQGTRWLLTVYMGLCGDSYCYYDLVVGLDVLGAAFCVLGGIFLIWLFVDFIRAIIHHHHHLHLLQIQSVQRPPRRCMTTTETAQATHMQTYYPQQQQPLPPQPPQQHKQRRRKLMRGLVWKFIVVCFFIGQGLSCFFDSWGTTYGDSYVASYNMWHVGIFFCFVGGIFAIWLFVDAIRAMSLCCMTRTETAQAIHMQTYYPPQQQPLPSQPPQQYYPRPPQQQQYAYPPQQQYGQYQGGMAMGAPTMALNQAASGSGGGSTGQPE